MAVNKGAGVKMIEKERRGRPRLAAERDKFPTKSAGGILQALRESLGYTRLEFERISGLSDSSIKSYELGQPISPTVEQFNKFHDALVPAGFVGWVLLEEYGFKTDVSDAPEVMPALTQTIRMLDPEQQRFMLGVAQNQLKLLKSVGS
ncbi:MAG: helix-turn-helix transcriptional regulator [Patescibacteria group bacterium]|nr:helix-turn-helix transcriptional regulator [Patescibacteria group bacterium]